MWFGLVERCGLGLWDCVCVWCGVACGCVGVAGVVFC